MVRRSLDSVFPNVAALPELPGVVERSKTHPCGSLDVYGRFKQSAPELELVKIPLTVFMLPALASLELAGTKVIGFAEQAVALNTILHRRINRVDGWIRCRTTTDVLESLQSAVFYSKDRGDSLLRLWLEPEDLDATGTTLDCNSENTSDSLSRKCILRTSGNYVERASRVDAAGNSIRRVHNRGIDSGLLSSKECREDDDSDDIEAMERGIESPDDTESSATQEKDISPPAKESTVVSKREFVVSFADQVDASKTSVKIRSLTETKFVEPYMTSDMVYRPTLFATACHYVWSSPKAFIYGCILLTTLVLVLFVLLVQAKN